LASESKSLLAQRPRTSAETGKIAWLANQGGLSGAQRWLLRERSWINEVHLALCRIPAPTFFESTRAAWFRDQLAALGWNARLDRAGNVRAHFSERTQATPLVVSAHLDTVLSPARQEDVSLSHDGELNGPGVSDNGSGLAALLALARLFAETPELHTLASQILLVANVGEEGEGNLNGMRYLCRYGLEAAGVRAFLVLDGPSTAHITSQALASRRFEVVFNGPGGHSWNDYGTPNPVHALADLISDFVQSAEPRVGVTRRNRCSYNFGIVEGGTGINAIPSSARTKLDLRSESPLLLDELSALLSGAVERSLERENRASRGTRLTAKIKEIGSRPGGRLADDAPLLRTIKAVDAYLGIRSTPQCASTDANVPLSMGWPALSIGAGGQGGGAHTASEWYHSDGREVGIWRILLLLAAVQAESPAPDGDQPFSTE